MCWYCPAPEYGDDRDSALRDQIAAALGARLVVARQPADRDRLLTAIDAATRFPTVSGLTKASLRGADGGHPGIAVVWSCSLRAFLGRASPQLPAHCNKPSKKKALAAEIARHGGMALCAVRSNPRGVRKMVERHGDFLLVHVATPLAECERRDRKVSLHGPGRARLPSAPASPAHTRNPTIRT
jgi:sulfate adenylyltransferase